MCLLMLLCIEGMFFIITSNDLFYIYLGIELQSLSLYILASLKKYSNLSIEAGLKYFLLGSFASGMFLYGISIIYVFLGTTSLNDLNSLLFTFVEFSGGNDLFFCFGVGFGMTMILVGLLFKLGVAPFHFWIADVYEGSPLIITYFFSVLPKISILFLLIRVFFFSYGFDTFTVFNGVFSYYFISVLIICSLLSIIIGSIGALYQITIKRLFAYSAIVNMGYMVLSLCTLEGSLKFITFYYLFIYILMSINLFAILMVIRRYPSKLKLRHLVEFVSVSHSNFILSILCAFCLLSLAGVPPLAGFFGKFFIFLGLISKGYYFLALFGVLFSVLTCVYYISWLGFYDL